MDPTTLATLASILGPALWEVFKTLLEKGKDILLDQGFELFKDWLKQGYDTRQGDEKLRSAILAALDDLKKSGEIDKYDSLLAVLKFTGLDSKTRLMLAGAAVEMTKLSTSALPPDLIAALELNSANTELLARFLFALRKQLAGMDKYQDGIHYADELDKRGELRGIAAKMADVAERLATITSMEAEVLRDRRLTTDEKQALQDYLAEMRTRWEGLMLPLLRKKSGAVTDARLKQVFVPLDLRDVQAEEQARKKMERLRKPEPSKEEQPRPVEIGELLNRYPRFILIGPPGCGKTTLLTRVALAFAEGRAADDLGWKGGSLIPVFLRLRNFGAFLKENRAKFSEPCSGSLVAYLENQLRDGERMPLTADFFDCRLAEGSCIILMDGLDEVAEMRSEVAGHIQASIARYGDHGNCFGLASRPRGYESVEMRLRPSRLAVAEVNPLDLRGIRQLIENLLTLIEPDAKLRRTDLDNLTSAIAGSDELTAIAGTPLFCSALVQVYKYHGARLPNRRVDVFDEIVDLLLGYWHASKRHLSQAEQMALEDGTGQQYREVKDAVTIKQRRLSHLAEHMQWVGKAEIGKDEAVRVLAEYLQQRERVPNEETACAWADNFLVSSHELSGLLVEHDPGTYTFLHKGFMEYLAATALVNQSKTLVETVLSHITDEWWEQVVLLAGAHPRLAEDVRTEMIRTVLEKAETLPHGSSERQRHLVMAGGLARDMAESLPGPEHELVETTLMSGATDTELPPDRRAEQADALDALGYVSPDLYAFVPIPDPEKPEFLIARYPVTNAQYARFLRPENFREKALWCGFPMFDENSQHMKKDWEEAGWNWLEEQKKAKDSPVEGGILYPPYWREQRFGNHRPLVPVVTISWYEANAYCKWLLAHWQELDEGKQGLPKPKTVRLPTRVEWVIAAGGEKPEERFPWDDVGKADTIRSDEKATVAEVVRRANIRQSEIGRTSPVWMFPQGESKPYGLMDLGGNVWEWQANYLDKDHDVLWLSGGSWDGYWFFARVSCRNGYYPASWYFSLGFRVLFLPS